MARILITGFCSYPGPHRLGVQLEHVIEGLQRNHQVDVLCLRGENQAHNERMGSTRVLRVSVSEPTVVKQIESFRRALRRQIEGDDYDIIHFRDGWTGTTALNMQAKHGYLTVFDLARSPLAEPQLTDLATAKELEHAHLRCIQTADLVLAPTEAVRQHLAKHTELAKVCVVPLGVNIDRFDWEPPSVDGKPVVLYLGSLHAGCGIRMLITSFEEVSALTDATLVLAGHASETFARSVQTLVEDLKLEGRVRMLGEISNHVAPAVIARASVCVVPSAVDLESVPTAIHPTKLLEYMACKRAVVAPNRSSVRNLVRDNQQALLFKAGSADDLTGKLLRMLKDSGLRNRLAQSGYAMVRASHTASGTRRGLRGAYKTILHLARQSDFHGSPTKTGSITDLGLDVGLTQSPGVTESRTYSEETVMYHEAPGAPVDAGDVTQVQAFPLPGDPKRDAADANSLSSDAGDEYTDEWQIEELGIPQAVNDGDRTGPMSAAARNVIVEGASQQQAQTRVVQSPFASSEETVGGGDLPQGERKVAVQRSDETQPRAQRPVPRAPRLPKAKSAGPDKPKKAQRGAGGAPPIPDNKRS